MDDGKVVGYGTHEELEKTCALYQNMVYLQRLEDPRAKGSDCHTGSTVSVKKIPKTSTTMLDQYEFTVIIKCKKYTSGNGSGVIFKS